VTTPDQSTDEQRIAERYLKRGRVVISMVPAGKLDLISKPERPYEKPSAAVPSGGGAR